MKFTINQLFSTLRPYNPFFWPQTDSTLWIITFPCPEVTLDTFGFPVGARFKNGIFGPQRPPWRPPCDEFKTKTLSLFFFIGLAVLGNHWHPHEE